MPVETRVSKEFGDLVRETMQGDTYGKATIKTGISQAYLLAMSRGKVPSRAIIERFAAGYNTEAQPLLVAAGYEEASDPVEACIVKLRGVLSRADLEAVRADLNARIARQAKANEKD